MLIWNIRTKSTRLVTVSCKINNTSWCIYKYCSNLIQNTNRDDVICQSAEYNENTFVDLLYLITVMLHLEQIKHQRNQRESVASQGNLKPWNQGNLMTCMLGTVVIKEKVQGKLHTYTYVYGMMLYTILVYNTTYKLTKMD